MSVAVDQLTDKEKEALRLLLDGHDTKSSAAELDISVHTVNDRLRNARRKLGVSSSREAARILRDAEGATPQNTVRTSFGIEGAEGATDNAILTQTKRAWPFRITWLAGGMLIMSIVIAAAVLAVISSSGADSAASSADTANSTFVETQDASDGASEQASPAAIARARSFIGAVDAGNWEESWNRAGEYFRSQASAAEWSALVEPVRSPLGAVSERRLVSVQRVQTLPGAPEGDYEILQYQTKYENLELLSTETVILVRNGDTFDVAGYFIR